MLPCSCQNLNSSPGPQGSFLGSLFLFKLSQLSCCLEWSSKSSMLNSSLNRAHFVVSSEVKITFNLHPKIIIGFILPAHVGFILFIEVDMVHFLVICFFTQGYSEYLPMSINIDLSHFLMVSWYSIILMYYS